MISPYIHTLSRIESDEVARVDFLNFLMKVLSKPNSNFQSYFSPRSESKDRNIFITSLLDMFTQRLYIEFSREKQVTIDTG